MWIVQLIYHGQVVYYAGYVTMTNIRLEGTSEFTRERDFATKFSSYSLADPIRTALLINPHVQLPVIERE